MNGPEFSYRWYVKHADNSYTEVCCSPARTRSQMALDYPEARLTPLPEQPEAAKRKIDLLRAVK